MKLSKNAIKDLRKEIRKKYGKDVEVSFNDDHVNNIGLLFLTLLVESLKLK